MDAKRLLVQFTRLLRLSKAPTARELLSCIQDSLEGSHGPQKLIMSLLALDAALEVRVHCIGYLGGLKGYSVLVENNKASVELWTGWDMESLDL